MDILKSIAWIIVFIILELGCTISESTFSCCKKLKTTLDCTNCNLKSLPIFAVDNTTTELLLANNKISNIPEGGFRNFTSLKKLTLTNNPLQDLNKETFRGLVSLEHLGLGSTSMEKPPTLPADILSTVPTIKTLNLFYSYPSELPSRFLQPMKNLETLKMSLTPEAVLGDEFQSLTKLKSLHIMHLRNAGLHDIKGQVFSAVPQIEELIIVGAVKSMGSDTLNSFTKLSSLRLLCNKGLSISEVVEAIANMKGPTLSILVLDGSDNLDFYYVTPDLFNSSNFANITHLSLKNTHMGGIDPEVVYNMPNLRYMSLGFNSLLTTGKFRSDYIAWQSITSMKLESLDISNMYQRAFPDSFHRQYCRNSENTFRSPPSYIKPPKTLDMNKTFVPPGYSQTVKAHLPPSLLYIFANYFGWHAFQKQDQPLVFNDNNVLYIDLSSSNMESLPLTKGFMKLLAADFHNNRLQSLDLDQLNYMPCLAHLNFRNNLLDKMDLTAFLAGGSRLQWLDIGYNNLKRLPSLLLANLTSLEYASFSGNPLNTPVSLDLHRNKKLTMLDLSSCALANLTDTFCQEIEDLQLNLTHTLSLNISDNRFECSCATLYMIHWLQHTNVSIIDKEHINCKYKNMSTAIYTINYAELSRECEKKTISLIVYISAPLGVVFVMILMLISVYQFRWHLRWFIYKLRCYLRHSLLKTDQNLFPMQMDQQYHAFVCHNHEDDYEWVVNELMPVVEDQWGLRLCIEERDFIPGQPILENTADAIENSRQIILVITPAFAASKWCDFQMHMAMAKGRRNIIVIYKEEVPYDDLSNALRTILRSINYIEYSQDPAGLRIFWESLRNSLVNY